MTKNLFRLFCKQRVIEYSDELWVKYCRLTKNAISRAKDPKRKTLIGAICYD